MPTRYEREIQQILDESNRQVDRIDPKSDPNSKQSATQNEKTSNSSIGRKEPIRSHLRITTYKIVGAGVLSLLLSGLLSWLLPSASGPLVWIGIGLFIIAYLKYFIGPRRPVERRWRGQIIEVDPSHRPLPLVEAIKRLFKFTR